MTYYLKMFYELRGRLLDKKKKLHLNMRYLCSNETQVYLVYIIVNVLNIN